MYVYTHSLTHTNTHTHTLTHTHVSLPFLPPSSPCVSVRVTLYDYQALCWVFSESSGGGHTLLDVSPVPRSQHGLLAPERPLVLVVDCVDILASLLFFIPDSWFCSVTCGILIKKK